MIQKTHTIQDKRAIKDNSKGQKIVAALYLVTNHLPDLDPLRNAIRTQAITLITQTDDTAVVSKNIIDLLHIAQYASLMSEQNVAILVKEITYFLNHYTSPAHGIFGTLFDVPPVDMSLSSSYRNASRMSFTSENVSKIPTKNHALHDNKNKRQEQILTFINDRKSAAIKDIATLFTDVSEKTIQRELGALVDSGQITKRGSKRWSIYLSAHS